MATALIISYVESVLELNIVVPGVKIGIGNVLLTYVLYEYGFPTAAGFGLTRSFLSMFFLGRLSSAIFSLTGMVFAVLAMGAAKKVRPFSPLGVNVSGSVLHVFRTTPCRRFCNGDRLRSRIASRVCVRFRRLRRSDVYSAYCRSEIRREAKKTRQGKFPAIAEFCALQP